MSLASQQMEAPSNQVLAAPFHADADTKAYSHSKRASGNSFALQFSLQERKGPKGEEVQQSHLFNFPAPPTHHMQSHTLPFCTPQGHRQLSHLGTATSQVSCHRKHFHVIPKSQNLGKLGASLDCSYRRAVSFLHMAWS